MTDILNQIQTFIRQVIGAAGYPGIGFVMMLENLIPPIPSELVMPFAGFLVWDGRLSYAGVVVAGTLGAVIGAVVIYEVGQRVGEERVEGWLKRYGKFLLLSPGDLGKALNIFEERGEWSVFLGRLVPGVRSLISLPAGMREMNLPKFLLLTAAGSLLWNAILAGAGIYLGQNWQQVVDILSNYEIIVWVLLAIGVGYFIFTRLNQDDGEQTES